MQCIPRHLQLTIVESALCCPCLEPLFSLGSQTACTQCTFSTLPGVIVQGTGSQPSYTASSEQTPIHFTAENSISGTLMMEIAGFESIIKRHWSTDPDPLVRGMDPRIRIRIHAKMSRIRNTASNQLARGYHVCIKKGFWNEGSMFPGYLKLNSFFALLLLSPATRFCKKLFLK
jgi:hypothetical protein